jgi:hypothetical protein
MDNENFQGTEIFNGNHLFIVTKHFNGKITHVCVMQTATIAAIINCGKLQMTNTDSTKEWEGSAFYNTTQNIQLEKEI